MVITTPMGNGLIVTLIVAGVVAVVIVLIALIYNGLVTLRNRVLNAYSQIDVQLKRRHDLIPNLVETVKGYMAHEKGTLEAVIAARDDAAAAGARVSADPKDGAALTQLFAAESVLQGKLGMLMGRAEAYPELKANEHASRLMEELSSTENRVAFARQAYNDATMRYNTKRETFPAVVLARPMGFATQPLFQVDDAAERAPVAVSLGR